MHAESICSKTIEQLVSLDDLDDFQVVRKIQVYENKRIEFCGE